MHRFLLFLCLIPLSSSFLQAQDGFKVVGYLPYYRFSYLNQIDFSQLTHLNLAFANPDLTGQLSVGGQDIVPAIQLARQHGVSVMASLAGGGLTDEWEEAWNYWMQPDKRSAYIHNIVAYTLAYELDGVDLDLEWGYVNSLYSPFVLELRDSMTANGLLLTAALPGTHRYPQITDEALAAFDWINMMVYDLTGPWAPNTPGPHSPYYFAVNAINYWRAQGVPSDKLTLGVPFYGYDFSTTTVSSFTYRTLVSQDPAYAYVDQVGMKFYNGIPTIQLKTELALAEVSGIMIWEIGQDAYNDLSLLNAINEVVQATPVRDLPAQAPLAHVYPNPFGDELAVENRSGSPLGLRLLSLDGRPVGQYTLQPGALHWLNTASLAPGFYLLQVVGEQGREVYRVVHR
ncbi:MAG: T9SS type A sorting domain-containing protein [Phaeodactylibacter sp.]|nr:T9SS type A sorting domain-containing protein [Phaeodactylibacter sp.]